MVSVAVAITSHNRRRGTLSCLEQVYAQKGRSELFDLVVVLVDAASSDGTVREVRRLFPDVHVVEVSSDVFWGAGMRTALATADARWNPDFYLWLNDDVELTPTCVMSLLEVHERASMDSTADSIVIGHLIDENGLVSYGALSRTGRTMQLTTRQVSAVPEPCDTMNGNVVLVPREVHRRLGNIDRAFPHGMGDIDYGLRAVDAGIDIIQCPGSVGVCNRNPTPAVRRRVLARLKESVGTKRTPPRSWATLVFRHCGLLAPIIFMKPYLNAVFARPAGNDVQRSGRSGVAHVFVELRYSGAEILLASDLESDPLLASRVIATGLQVGPFAQVLEDVVPDIRHRPFRADPRWLLELRRDFRGMGVVHIHCERASFWIALSALSAGCRVVRSVHSVFAFDGKLRLRRALQRRLLRLAGVHFVAISRAVYENEKDRFGISSCLVTNAANRRFSGLKRNRHRDAGKERSFTILTVGNCETVKNHVAIIEAIALLGEAGEHVRYAHVGESGQVGVEEQRLADELGLIERVQFMGTMAPDKILADADLFVMPSLREGIGVAVLEALAAGVPTLLARSPGLDTFSEISGIHWADPTPAGIADTLRQILRTEPAELEALARTAREQSLAEFGHERRVSQLRRLYAGFVA